MGDDHCVHQCSQPRLKMSLCHKVISARRLVLKGGDLIVVAVTPHYEESERRK